MATTKITSRSLETGAALANLNAGASVALTVPVTATNYNPGTNVATFLATPTSANLLAAVTDETGTGSLVFATSPTLTTPTIAQINGGTAANDDITIQGTTNATRTTSYVNLQPSGGNVGIGTITPTAKLDVRSTETAISYFNSSAASTRLLIDNAANTGFGLQIAGATKFSNAVYQSGTGNFDFTIYNDQLSQSSFFVDGSTNNVGIGTTSPFTKFDVNAGSALYLNAFNIYGASTTGAGSVFGKISNSNTAGRTLLAFSETPADASTPAFIERYGSTHSTKPNALVVGSSGSLELQTNLTTRLFITTSGEVGMGTTSPNTKAALDITSTTKGFLPPRMTTAQRDAITSVPAGLMIYNTDTNKLNVFTTAWEAVTSL